MSGYSVLRKTVAPRDSRYVECVRQNSSTIETRFHDSAPEIRIERTDGKSKLVGYAIRWLSISKDLGGFKERVLPGAATRSLSSGNDIRALVDHDPSKLLGRTSNGSLRLAEDANGLRVEVSLPPTTYAQDLAALVERGDVRGMSFGFRVARGGERFTEVRGERVRELSEIDLKEVTFTSIPAYPATSVALRNNAARLTYPVDTARRRLKIQRLLSH